VDLDLTRQDGVVVAAVRGQQLDARSAPELTEVLEREIEAGASRIVIDMRDVFFLDSSGLGALIRLLKRLPPNGNLALSGCRASILELLKLTRIDKILAAYPSREEAIASLRA